MPDRGGTSRLLLVEGVPGLGKSTTIDGVVRRYVETTSAERIRTVVALAQTHTYGPLAGREDDSSLTKADNLEHLDIVVRGLEWLIDGAGRQTRTKCVIVVDTLHLTHCLRPGVLDWHDVEPIDRRLASLGARLLLIDGAEETIRQRTVLARAGTEFIKGYALGRFGNTPDALVSHFVRERDRFRVLFEASAMVKRVIAAEIARDEMIGSALDFWLDPRDAVPSTGAADIRAGR